MSDNPSMVTFVLYAENGINLSSEELRFLSEVKKNPEMENEGFFIFMLENHFLRESLAGPKNEPTFISLCQIMMDFFPFLDIILSIPSLQMRMSGCMSLIGNIFEDCRQGLEK